MAHTTYNLQLFVFLLADSNRMGHCFNPTSGSSPAMGGEHRLKSFIILFFELGEVILVSDITVKKYPYIWFCFQKSLYLQSFRNKTYKNGLSDIQGTDVPDGVF